MNVQVLIVDDEAPARDELAYLLEAHPDLRVSQAATAQAALEHLRQRGADLVFQDIQMPGQDGFHVLAEAQALPHPPLFVFVTAFDQHAIRAFEENAADYLLKPVSPRRLEKSLERVRRLLEEPCRNPWQDTLERLLASRGRASLPRLAVEQGGRVAMIPLARVVLVEAEEKKVFALTDQGRFVCHCLNTLGRAAERLEGLPFFQANRAQLVNVERIAEFSPWFGGKYLVVMNDQARTEVTVSRNRAREFKQRVGI
ncbi:Sensory transduction protein LytR [Fundidesulfovibrio magnetotacticus]|uniref:Sensory transduction protein LytR n=1 Tax=Fundidesulfovibrio magnetotacticus TaxID=2730080 RepID=A0A6V8LKG8_9BACT|nr:LytTR family DNA-binding domain-containing protein [Fundidesulfovibrio magnetotacticus]GFK93193.1 Sensory transduction protein LytR [Fundidesulfovibrio magnetotacticus]